MPKLYMGLFAEFKKGIGVDFEAKMTISEVYLGLDILLLEKMSKSH